MLATSSQSVLQLVASILYFESLLVYLNLCQTAHFASFCRARCQAVVRPTVLMLLTNLAILVRMTYAWYKLVVSLLSGI